MSSFSISSISTMILSLLQLLELISRTRALGSIRSSVSKSGEEKERCLPSAGSMT